MLLFLYSAETTSRRCKGSNIVYQSAHVNYAHVNPSCYGNRYYKDDDDDDSPREVYTHVLETSGAKKV